MQSLHDMTAAATTASAAHRSVVALSSTTNNGAGSPSAGARKVPRNNRSYKPFPEHVGQHESDDESAATTAADADSADTPKRPGATAAARRKQATTHLSSTKGAAAGPRGGNSTTSGRQQTNQREQQQQQLLANGESEAATLYAQLVGGQCSMQSVVDDWIELYKRDKETAMLDLIKLIVRSTGCKSSARTLDNKHLLRTKEFTDPIIDLIEDYNGSGSGEGETAAADSADIEVYPLVQTSAQARKFKANLSEFLALLINQCQYSIVYDQFMLDILISFLIALADSQVRAFRHTATLCVLKIMTALVDVLLAISIAKDACQRQHDNERNKAQARRATERLDMLAHKRKELDDNEYEVQNFVNFIFKAVFVHRYRDVCADIRCVCIVEIGEWMHKCPSKFLDDTFLKYIGWTLYDRVAECRLKCLHALAPLYEQGGEMSARLELFTSRFRARLVEMSLDKESDVCVAAIRLLTCIVKHNDAALEDRDCETLYELVYHTSRAIAQAAGEFLNQKLFVKFIDQTMANVTNGGNVEIYFD